MSNLLCMGIVLFILIFTFGSMFVKIWMSELNLKGKLIRTFFVCILFYIFISIYGGMINHLF